MDHQTRKYSIISSPIFRLVHSSSIELVPCVLYHTIFRRSTEHPLRDDWKLAEAGQTLCKLRSGFTDRSSFIGDIAYFKKARLRYHSKLDVIYNVTFLHLKYFVLYFLGSNGPCLACTFTRSGTVVATCQNRSDNDMKKRTDLK
ncbi:hypothetical protein CHS0354_038727 [Potamilus streckersoni]|uniref:Uncharacterized protein n=1 Tax=Potamilus streckersoni TaxID=2493646 RepID=A0AAE0VUS9_9BIVA|nr:hypothetical protein CHS0354_038727 [Potamilus streckersoni]